MPPDAMPPPDGVTPEDFARCRALLGAGSKSFALAARLLPSRVRESATVLYAFCRVADNAIDDAPAGAAPRALAELTLRLDTAYAACVEPRPDPIDRALAAVVARDRIPMAVLEALLEGFAWDTEARRYETLEDLERYAVRVAGTVGAMMTLVMGRRARDTLARACELGVAMQLTNIARDVGEDAARGRIYLPLAWLRDEGIDPDAWLARPVFSEALGRVVRRLLDTAAVLYERAAIGIDELPRGCRGSIRLASLVYEEIGAEVARAGYDSVSHRAVVPKWRKLWLMAWAFLGGPGGDRSRLTLPLTPLSASTPLLAVCTETS